MALTLNHYSIRTTDLDACRVFYEQVLGMSVGPRPDFPFPGLWMYAGDHTYYGNAVVHIIGIDRNDPAGLKQYLGDRDETALQGTGTIDHIAFFTDGLSSMLERLKRLNVAFRERTVPGLGLHQVFIDDPNGVVIELNYPAHEKQSAGTAESASPASA
ncbi:VOC family protein [Noviherbaspirillum galbum]|uniref:Glyoxalase n=1 Tax=Noviherbaspirillum galbum TaxID=2709383 RepID=A0A6B3SNZ5_9BURK|nr:VOC family protein [Noviherbaspirillum galbum]NEX62534.1 glyoxalase [Noviherbaspirillum galbum]